MLATLSRYVSLYNINLPHISLFPTSLSFDLRYLCAGVETENVALMPEHKLEKKFGQSPVFVASTLLEDGGSLKSTSPASLLKEAIHVISCGYEDKTEWGKEVTSVDEEYFA